MLEKKVLPGNWAVVSVEWPDTVTAAKRGDRTVVVNCSEASVETPIGKLDPFELVFR